MGRAPAGAEETEGAGRPAGGRARPLPAARGSAPPSATATATAAPRRPPGPRPGGVPRGRARGPPDRLREAGPGPAGGPGSGGRGGEGAKRGRPRSAARPGLPGPPRAGPRSRVSAGAQLPRDLAGPDAADPARCGPSTLDRGTSTEGLGWKGSENITRAPIAQTRPRRPERGRSLRTREGTWRDRQLSWVPPRRGSAECGGRPRALNRLVSAPAPERGGDKRPSPGSEAANSPLESPAPCPSAESRAVEAHSCRPRARPPAARAPGLPGRPPPPRSRRNKSESSAEEQRASREGRHRARRGALRDPRMRATSASRDQARVAGARVTRRAAHIPSPGCDSARAGARSRAPAPSLACLTLPGYSKLDPAAPGVRARSFSVACSRGGSGSLPRPPSSPPRLRGSSGNGRLQGSRRRHGRFSRPQTPYTASRKQKGTPASGAPPPTPPPARPLLRGGVGLCLWGRAPRVSLGPQGGVGAHISQPPP